MVHFLNVNGFDVFLQLEQKSLIGLLRRREKYNQEFHYFLF